MCGIYGMLWRDRDRPVDMVALERMGEALHHRGPDGAGTYVERGFGMGMRRLSIIDLKTGQQPISNEDGTVWVVFNGEIYNYRQLTAELIGLGHAFRTASDTEVIVHLYEEHGERCVEWLNGMFAFAIWTPRDATLFLGRDRLGIKPLYYADVPGEGFVFASELKAIGRSGRIERSIDDRGLADYLQLGYVPDPYTILRDVKKLPAGETLTIRREFSPRPQSYWRPTNFLHQTPSPETAVAADLWSHIQAAVTSHLVSDVPVGVFLSGGLDSSTIVAAMTAENGKGIPTFSVGFTERAFDESPYARRVAEVFGTDHHEIVVGPRDVDIIDDVLAAFDEPFADASAIPTYLVAKLAREHVKVVLSGDGGDEIFAGYTRYARDTRARYLGRLGDLGWGAPLRAMSSVLPEGTPGKNYLFTMSLPRTERYLDEMCTFPPRALSHLLEPAVVRHATPLAALAAPEAALLDPLSTVQDIDLRTYLPGDILTKVDRMTMAHSLEARVPLLDHRLVEFACALAPTLRMRSGVTKYFLREALRGRLPADIVHRPKQGFGVPLGIWFSRENPRFFRERLADRSRLESVGVRGAYVSALIDRFERHHRADHCARLWALMVLERSLGMMFARS